MKKGKKSNYTILIPALILTVILLLLDKYYFINKPKLVIQPIKIEKYERIEKRYYSSFTEYILDDSMCKIRKLKKEGSFQILNKTNNKMIKIFKNIKENYCEGEDEIMNFDYTEISDDCLYFIENIIHWKRKKPLINEGRGSSPRECKEFYRNVFVYNIDGSKLFEKHYEFENSGFVVAICKNNKCIVVVESIIYDETTSDSWLVIYDYSGKEIIKSSKTIHSESVKISKNGNFVAAFCVPPSREIGNERKSDEIFLLDTRQTKELIYIHKNKDITKYGRINKITDEGIVEIVFKGKIEEINISSIIEMKKK